MVKKTLNHTMPLLAMVIMGLLTGCQNNAGQQEAKGLFDVEPVRSVVTPLKPKPLVTTTQAVPGATRELNQARTTIAQIEGQNTVLNAQNKRLKQQVSQLEKRLASSKTTVEKAHTQPVPVATKNEPSAKDAPSLAATKPLSLQEKGQALLKKVAQDKRFIALGNGASFRVITPGSNPVKAGQMVSTTIRESLADGTITADMEKGGQVFSQTLEQYSPLFSAALEKHVGLGGEIVLVIPPELAYGSAGHGELVPPDAVMVYNIKVVGVQ